MKVQLKFSMTGSRGRRFGGVVTAVILGTESVSMGTGIVGAGRGGRESVGVRYLDATERVAEDRSLDDAEDIECGGVGACLEAREGRIRDLLEGRFLDSRVRTVSIQGRFAGSSSSLP
jgi:hypothetical protein